MLLVKIGSLSLFDQSWTKKHIKPFFRQVRLSTEKTFLVSESDFAWKKYKKNLTNPKTKFLTTFIGRNNKPEIQLLLVAMLKITKPNLGNRKQSREYLLLFVYNRGKHQSRAVAQLHIACHKVCLEVLRVSGGPRS